ncbi:MAG: shikimate dehydrogenase [Tatlockia sp.]|nr:shikimate dehydrogenase [Tatlockia sp.]
MTERFAVMGNPINHSLSPLIHQRFAEQLSLELDYQKLLIPDESQFAFAVNNFFSKGGKGLNITLPFKQKAFALAHYSTARCQQAKAANTLWLEENRIQADNTDGIGLLNDLANYCELEGKRLLLLGAGGAARGVIGPLLSANITDLVVVNRSEARAKELAADFPQIKRSSCSELTGRFDLIVNATAASLNNETLELPQNILKSTTLCYDLSYLRAKKTVFVQWALDQGLQGVDGLGMLIQQAAESFYIWHGLRPDPLKVIAEFSTDLNCF